MGVGEHRHHGVASVCVCWCVRVYGSRGWESEARERKRAGLFLSFTFQSISCNTSTPTTARECRTARPAGGGGVVSTWAVFFFFFFFLTWLNHRCAPSEHKKTKRTARGARPLPFLPPAWLLSHPLCHQPLSFPPGMQQPAPPPSADARARRVASLLSSYYDGDGDTAGPQDGAPPTWASSAAAAAASTATPDGEGFDAEAHVARLLASTRLAGLLSVHASLTAEVKVSVCVCVGRDAKEKGNGGGMFFCSTLPPPKHSPSTPRCRPSSTKTMPASSRPPTPSAPCGRMCRPLILRPRLRQPP